MDTPKKITSSRNWPNSVPQNQQAVFHSTPAYRRTKGNSSPVENIKPLIGKWIIDRAVYSKILLYCNLETILELRRVSKEFLDLISSLKTNDPCNLANISAISFKYSELHPEIDPLIKEKFEFAQNNTEIHIKISFDDLLNLRSTLDFILESKLKIILELKNFEELNRLANALISVVKPRYIDKIKTLDYTRLHFDDYKIHEWSPALLTISNNAHYLPSLSTCVFGIVHSNNLPLPNSLKCLEIYFISTSLTLADSLTNLTTVRIEGLREDCTLTFPNSLNRLTKLALGMPLGMKAGSNIQLPDALNGLKTLIITSSGASLKLPDHLDSLEVLKILGDDPLTGLHLSKSFNRLQFLHVTNNIVWNDFIFMDLFHKFHNIKDLVIDCITKDDKDFTLPDLFKNITTLGIRKICVNVTFGISALSLPKSLKDLAIGNLAKGAVLRLLNAPENLTIHHITENITLELPDSLNDVVTFTISKIYPKAIFNLPNTFHNLRTLRIRNIEANAVVNLTNLPPLLTTLALGSIHNNATIQLPNSLNKVVTFTIERIHAKAIFELPNTFHNLRTLRIGNIEANAVVNLTNLPPRLTTLTFESIHNDATIQLPVVLPNGINLTIGNACDAEAYELLAQLQINKKAKEADEKLKEANKKLEEANAKLEEANKKLGEANKIEVCELM